MATTDMQRILDSVREPVRGRNRHTVVDQPQRTLQQQVGDLGRRVREQPGLRRDEWVDLRDRALDMGEQARGHLKRVLRYIFNIRAILTVFLLGWLIFISYFILRRDRNEEEVDESRRYGALHRAWFGEESIILILWKIWYVTIILFAFSPVIREFIVFMKLRMVI